MLFVVTLTPLKAPFKLLVLSFLPWIEVIAKGKVSSLLSGEEEDLRLLELVVRSKVQPESKDMSV